VPLSPVGKGPGAVVSTCMLGEARRSSTVAVTMAVTIFGSSTIAAFVDRSGFDEPLARVALRQVRQDCAVRPHPTRHVERLRARTVALGACVVDKVVIEGGLVDEDRRALWGVGREGAVLSTCMLGLGEGPTISGTCPAATSASHGRVSPE